MSANSNDYGAGQAASAGAGALQLPRLPAGGVGFAAWAANVDVALERAGAQGIHRAPETKERWLQLAARVEAWRSEELNAAMAFALGSAASDGAAASSSAPLSAEAEKVRKLLTTTVERSRRIY